MPDTSCAKQAVLDAARELRAAIETLLACPDDHAVDEFDKLIRRYRSAWMRYVTWSE